MSASAAVGLLLTLITSSTLEAGQLDLWIGFSAVQTRQMTAALPEGRISGKVRYIDVTVGSNEKPEEARPHAFTAHLSGAGSGGICSAVTEVITKVKPAVPLLRFQVFYPSSAEEAAPPVDYKLKASLTGDPDTSKNNNKHEFTFSFPGGGRAPTCVKLK